MKKCNFMQSKFKSVTFVLCLIMFFEFMNPISPSLKLMLTNGSATLLDVVTDETCQKSFQVSNALVIDFMESHADEVLEASLNYHNPVLSNSCFNLISLNNKRLTEAIAKLDSLPTIAAALFDDPKTDPVFINRLAVITQLCMLSFPQYIPTKLSYFTRFLQYLELRSVYDLFTAILQTGDSDEDTKPVRQVLDQMNFTATVRDEIARFPEQLSSTEASVASSIFSLIPLLVKAEISDAQSAETLTVLLRQFKNPSLKLLNSQWNAIVSSFKSEPIALIQENLDSLIDLLVGADKEVINQYQVYILTLLGHIAHINAEFANALAEKTLFNSLAQLLEKFPKHTFFQRALHGFIIDMLVQEGPATTLLNSILPICSKYIQGEYVELRSFSWNLMKTLTVPDENSNLPEFTKSLVEALGEETKAGYDKINAIAGVQYGGSKPEPAAETDMTNISPDQLLAILQLLSRR